MAAGDPLLRADVLAEETADLVGLDGLDARDAMMQQITKLHI